MKTNTRLLIVPAALLLFGASSCSMLQKSGNESKNETLTVPQDRRPVVPVRPSDTYTPAELKKGVVKGDWAIETVNGKNAVGESAPYIKFEPTQKKIYGNNGCNTINGDYTYSAQHHTLTFSNLITTMMACGMQGITDTEINVAMNMVRSYKLEERNHQYWMHLYDGAGKEVMTLMHQNFDFLNGTWLVQSIKEKKINEPGKMLVPDMKLVIDVPEGKVHGNTGCNILNGDFEIDMDVPNSISFQNMATTRMACPPDNNFETDMLVALEEATTAHPVNANTIELLNSQKQVIMVLVRTTDTTSK